MRAIKIALIASAVAFSSAALALPVKMTDAEMSQIVAGQPPAGSPAWKDMGIIYEATETVGEGNSRQTTSTVQTCVSTGKNCTGIALITTQVTKTKADWINPGGKLVEGWVKTGEPTTITVLGNAYRMK